MSLNVSSLLVKVEVKKKFRISSLSLNGMSFLLKDLKRNKNVFSILRNISIKKIQLGEWGKNQTIHPFQNECKKQTLMCHLAAVLVMIFRLPGFRISLSGMLTICSNLGLLFLSFCQQSSISWYNAAGQSIGGGSRQPSSTALITCVRSRVSRDLRHGTSFTSSWAGHINMNILKLSKKTLILSRLKRQQLVK